MLDSVVIEPSSPARFSVIWLHGLGADGHDFVNIIPEFRLPDSLNIRFVFPHAPIRPITINANLPTRAWYDIYSLQDTSREDIQGIEQSEQAIRILIENQIESGIAAENIVLAGFSQGGAMALYTGLHYPKTLCGILALSSYLPRLNEMTHHIHEKNRNTPIMMTHGEHDDVLPIQLGLLSKNQLEAKNLPIEWHSYPMGHEVCFEEIEDIRNWLMKLTHSTVE